jgi:FKBP-type peptidyl-prolyl cis-trans isomerase
MPENKNILLMKLGTYIYPFLVLFVIIGFASCNKTTLQLQVEKETYLLDKYIGRYHKGTAPTESGLFYFNTKVGTGNDIVAGDYVKIFYKGYLIEDNDTMGIQDGYLFDTSGDYEPFSFTVGGGSVISGWDEAITYMKDGGEAKWIIPSKIAYGGSNMGTIPSYSTLVFYVRLFKVYRSTDTFKTFQKVPRYPMN